jgi:Ger(x)C family germination protein
MMVRSLIMLVAMIGLLQVAGCSNGKQLNRISFITAIGIDKADSGIKVHALIAVPGKFTALSPGGGGSTGQTPNYILSETGTNVEEALFKMKRKSSRGLSLGHTRLIFFSDELAEEGIEPYLDLFMRKEEFQINSWVAVTKGSTKDVLQVKPEIPQSVADYFVDVFSSEGSDSMEILPIYLYQFYSFLHEPGKSPYAMMISKQKTGNKLQLTGLGLFRNDKMVGTLTPKETKYLQMINDKPLKSLTLTLMQKSYTVLGYNTKTEIAKDKIKLDMNLRIELDDYPPDTPVSYQKIRDIESKIADAFQKDVENLVREMQSSRTDPAGFGQRYRISVDKNLQADEWLETIFPEMDIDVLVKVNIERKGMLT